MTRIDGEATASGSAEPEASGAAPGRDAAVHPTLGPVLVAAASFGAFSREPWTVAEAEGLDLRRPSVPGPHGADALVRELAAVGEPQAVIVGVDRVDRAVFEAVPSLRVVGKHGVGTDNVDLEAAREHGVRVVVTPGANAGAVADMAVALLLAGVRRLVEADASLRAGEWRTFAGRGVESLTVALLGFGRIGQGVARRLAGFDATVIAYDPFLPAHVFAAQDVESVSLDDALARADVVSLHLPHAPGEAPVLDAAAFARMRVGAGLVNTARGGLVDDAALADALASGHLGFAALDAFVDEPLGADSPLRSAPRTILTPHAAAFTDTANAAMGAAVVADVARVLRGEDPVAAVV